MSKLLFLPDDHALQSVEPSLVTKMRSAQDSLLTSIYPNMRELLRNVLEDLKLAIPVPTRFADQPVENVLEIPFKDLNGQLASLVREGGVAEKAVDDTTLRVAQRTQLLTAFVNPDAAIESVETKIKAKVSGLPKKAEDIECGRNPGDVIDPYILAASQYLLFGGEFEPMINAAVSHKALMILEDLVGHLHEDVIGMMRGNVRVPEPRGVEQELLNPILNPFPGADIMQPPTKDSSVRFHQVKNKTGSAKGGDGARLGAQLLLLQKTYGGEIFYDALIGNTLRGHRSRAGVSRVAPNAVILVGQAAFRELTRSGIGPQLLLRVYQSAFIAVARESQYSIANVTEAIVMTFAERAAAKGESFLEALLDETISGDPSAQDSRFETPRQRASRSILKGLL